MDVSIIIVNFNTLHLTKNCIETIFKKTTEVSFEVILVDNASSDGSKEFFETDKRIKYFYLTENIGFGKANNYGIERAIGKYIFCLNNDTLLINNAVKLFFDYCEGKSNNNIHIGAVGCMLENADGEIIHSYGRFPSMKRILADRLISPMYTIMGKRYNKFNQKAINDYDLNVDYVTGADMFVNRELLKKLGAFDSDFFMYFEETELQNRLTKAGYPSMVISTPRIIHLEGASVNREVPPNHSMKKHLTNKLVYNQQSEFIYMRKTHPFLAYILYRFFFFIIRIPFLLLLSRSERRIYFNILIK